MENLDYKQMFGNLKEVLDKQFEMQKTYFALLCELNKLKPQSDIVCKRIMEMSMADQIKILKHSLAISQISKKMCEKYGWYEEDFNAE
jgi:hypothetical protein